MIYVVLETLKFFLASMFGVVICLFVQTFKDDEENKQECERDVLYVVKNDEGLCVDYTLSLENAFHIAETNMIAQQEEFFVEVIKK